MLAGNIALEFYRSLSFTSASCRSAPNIKNVSYLALASAPHERKPSLLNIFDHEERFIREVMWFLIETYIGKLWNDIANKKLPLWTHFEINCTDT